jgi:hypothetical protein
VTRVVRDVTEDDIPVVVSLIREALPTQPIDAAEIRNWLDDPGEAELALVEDGRGSALAARGWQQLESRPQARQARQVWGRSVLGEVDRAGLARQVSTRPRDRPRQPPRQPGRRPTESFQSWRPAAPRATREPDAAQAVRLTRLRPS